MPPAPAWLIDKAQARACIRAVYGRIRCVHQQQRDLDRQYQAGTLIDPAYDHARIDGDRQLASLFNALYEAYGNPARYEAWTYRQRAICQVLPHQLGARILEAAAYAHLPGMDAAPVVSISGPYVAPVNSPDDLAAAREQYARGRTSGVLLYTVVRNTTPPPDIDPLLIVPDVPPLYLIGNPRCSGPGFVDE